LPNQAGVDARAVAAAKLPGGQGRRVVIARTSVNKPRLSILDEDGAAPEPESEDAIRRTKQDIEGQLTILAIVHHG